jgi:hypothetical protein
MESAHLAPRRLIRSAKQTPSSFPRLLKLFGRLGIKTTWFIPEAVWGKFAQDLYGAFSVKRLLLGFSASSLFGAGKAVLRSLIAPQVAREFFPLEAVSSPWPVDRRAKRIPLWRWGRLVPVANRRAPRASRSALTSDGAARAGGCLFAHRGKPIPTMRRSLPRTRSRSRATYGCSAAIACSLSFPGSVDGRIVAR